MAEHALARYVVDAPPEEGNIVPREVMIKAKIIIVICICVAAYVALSLAGCSTVVSMCTSERACLDYVGTITLGVPVTSGRRTTIPVGFAGGRWHENSAIAFKRFKTSRHDYDIFITAETCVVGGDLPKYEIILKDLRSGSYSVYYLDPGGAQHEIGAIEVRNSIK